MGEFTETESRTQVSASWGEEKGQLALHGQRVFFWDDEKALETVLMVAQQCKYN